MKKSSKFDDRERGGGLEETYVTVLDLTYGQVSLKGCVRKSRASRDKSTEL